MSPLNSINSGYPSVLTGVSMLGRVSQFVSTFCQLKPMKLQGGTDMERGGGEEKKTQSVSREMGPWCISPPPIPFFSQGHSGIRVQGESHPVLITPHRMPQSSFPALVNRWKSVARTLIDVPGFPDSAASCNL